MDPHVALSKIPHKRTYSAANAESAAVAEDDPLSPSTSIADSDIHGLRPEAMAIGFPTSLTSSIAYSITSDATPESPISPLASTRESVLIGSTPSLHPTVEEASNEINPVAPVALQSTVMQAFVVPSDWTSSAYEEVRKIIKTAHVIVISSNNHLTSSTRKSKPRPDENFVAKGVVISPSCAGFIYQIPYLKSNLTPAQATKVGLDDYVAAFGTRLGINHKIFISPNKDTVYIPTLEDFQSVTQNRRDPYSIKSTFKKNFIPFVKHLAIRDHGMTKAYNAWNKTQKTMLIYLGSIFIELETLNLLSRNPAADAYLESELTKAWQAEWARLYPVSPAPAPVFPVITFLQRAEMVRRYGS